MIEETRVDMDRPAVNSDSFELIGPDLIDEMYFSESLCASLGLPYFATEDERENGYWSFCPGKVFTDAYGYDTPHRKLIAYYIVKNKRINLRPVVANGDSGDFHCPGWFKLVEHHSYFRDRPSITSLCE